MPFIKGQPRPAGAGRKPGAPVKRMSVGSTQMGRGVSLILKSMDCDPIRGMARIAKKAEKEQDFTLAGRMYAELAQYEHPKLKSIEVSGKEGSPLEITTSARELLTNRIAGIASRIGTAESSRRP